MTEVANPIGRGSEAESLPKYQPGSMEEAIEEAKNVTFKEFWAGIQQTWRIINEISERQKENEKLIQENAERQKRTDEQQRKTDEQQRITAEQQRKTDEQMKITDEQMRKTVEQMKRTDEQLGGLHNRFGDLAEHLVAPGINERFNKLGYHFDIMTRGGLEIRDENGKIKAEIDLYLENGETIMAVEVKATVKMKHIEEHIKRVEILRDYRRKRKDNRNVEGAIAGAIFGVDEKKAAIEAGFYVIIQSGDTMKIEVPDDFIPRRW